MAYLELVSGPEEGVNFKQCPSNEEMTVDVWMENYDFNGFFESGDGVAFAAITKAIAEALETDSLYFRMHNAPKPVSGKSFVFAMLAM